MTLLCALYARVSDEMLQTGEDKVSIATQIEDCRAQAAKLGAVVVSEYIDDRRYRDARGVLVDPAGWRPDRPAWLAELAAADRGEFTLIIAWHSTRLFRGYRPMADLLDVAERRRLKVECVKDSFNTELAPIYAWAAKQERQAFAARSAMGKVGRARRGLPTTRAPAHYEKVVDLATGKTTGYQLRPEARPWLDGIARLYLAGHGLHAIANTLVRHPITGTRLSARAISDVLTNPFNYGIVSAYRWAAGGRVGEFAGAHEPAWPPGTCAALRAELARRKYPTHTRVRGAGLFSGVVRCGICGRVMSITQNGRQPHIYKQYVCWHAKAYKTHAPVSILEPKLIRLVRQELAALTDADLAAAAARLTLAPAMSMDMLAGLEARQGDLVDQLAALEADLAAVRSPAARPAVAAQIADLQAELAGVMTQLEQAGAGPAPVDPAEILERARALRDTDTWHLPFEALRERIVKSLPALYVLQGQLVPAPKEI